jgi:uncharacterized membrane protein YgcG
MDKVRVALNWIVAHHFWLLSGLVVLMGLGVWFMAKSDLSAQYQTNMSKIKTVYDKADTEANKPFHPNEDVNQGQQREIDELVKDVTQTWESLYQRQREEALVWPPQLNSSFRNYIASRKFGDNIDVSQRQEYFQYIRGRFDDLPEIIDANEIDPNTPGFGGGGYAGSEGGGRGFGGGGFGGGRGFNSPEQLLDANNQPIDPDYIVYWEQEDQARIREELTSDRVLSHWRIWTTQEDLWVYEALLRAIAFTNKEKGATRHSNAAITNLGSMEVGKPAAAYSRTPGRIHRLEVASAPGAEGEEGGMNLQDYGDTSIEGGEGEGEGSDEYAGVLSGAGTQTLTPAQEKAAFLSRRYVDKEGKPIPVPAGEEPLDPSLFGTEFKQLPVRLRVRMDIRWINTLIVAMAESPMKIMITEVRIDPRNVEGGGGGGRGYGGEGLGGGYGGAQGSMFDPQSIQVFDRQPFMKEVILQGVVQIFNEPNPAAFGPTDGDGEMELTDPLVANP